MKETDFLGLKLMDNNPQDKALTFLDYRRIVNGYENSNMVKIDEFGKQVRSGLVSQTSLIGSGGYVVSQMTPGSSVSAKVHMSLSQSGTGEPSITNIRPFVLQPGACVCASTTDVRLGVGEAYTQNLETNITVKKDENGVFTVNGEPTETTRLNIWQSEVPFYIPRSDDNQNFWIAVYFDSIFDINISMHFQDGTEQLFEFSRSFIVAWNLVEVAGKAVDSIDLVFSPSNKYINAKFIVYFTTNSGGNRMPYNNTSIEHSVSMFSEPIPAGVYDMRTGELKKTWKIATLDGIQNKFDTSATVSNRRNTIFILELSRTVSGKKSNSIPGNIVFTHFPTMSNADIYNLSADACGGALNWNGNTSKLLIQLPESTEVTDAESMNLWLQNQVEAGTPVQVAWELSDPETVKEDVLSVELPDFDGRFVVWASSKDSEFYGTGELSDSAATVSAILERLERIEALYGIKIVTQPEDKLILYSSTNTFGVEAASPDNSLSYRWQYRTGANHWLDIPASTSSNKFNDTGDVASSTIAFTTPAVYDDNALSTHDGWRIRCKITNSFGYTVYSDEVILHQAYIEITKQPDDVRAASNGYAIFEVSARCGTAINYQWEVLTGSNVAWKDTGLAGNNTSKLNFKTISGYSGRYFRCRITDNDNNVVYSDPGQLTVYTVGTAATEITACKESMSYPYTEMNFQQMLIDGEMRPTDNISIPSSDANKPRNYYYKAVLSPVDLNGRSDEINEWTSSNTNVCKVARADNGLANRAIVTPVGNGVAEITATAIGGASVSFYVKVQVN